MAEQHKLVRDGEFPGNSNRSKQEVPESSAEKKVTKVISGNVIKQQKSFLQQLSQSFFGDDTRTVFDYILHDILIPAAKSTLSDMVGGGIEMLLFGERRSSSSRGHIYRDGPRSYVPYNRISRSRDDRDVPQRFSRSARSRHDFDEIVLEQRGEAEDVLSHLVDLIKDYGMASVADYYDLVGIEVNFTDNKWGWTNLRDAYVDRVRHGYVIKLPRTEEI